MNVIESGPHYELLSTELARWLDAQGADSWWSVDGDPLLTGRLNFPCPADELSNELRRLDRPLLVQAARGDSEARGQRITASDLGPLVTGFAPNLHSSGPLPEWANDRLLYLAWKGSPNEWLLAEDSVTARQFRAEAGRPSG